MIAIHCNYMYIATKPLAPAISEDAASGYMTAAGTESVSAKICSFYVKNLIHYSFMNIQIQGLKPKAVQSKIPYIQDLLNSHGYLFLGLSETWLRDPVDAKLHAEGYTIFRSDHARTKLSNRGQGSGGCTVYKK